MTAAPSPAGHADAAGYRPDIDGLRAVAVLLVVVYHAWPALLPGGYLGVDVFFVISGFLITTIIVRDLHDGRFSFRRFYARRARRILPALFVVLLAGLALGSYTLLAKEFEELGRDTVGATFFAANFVLMGDSGYFAPAAAAKPLLHLWSLGIEEQFYLTFPLLAWLGWRCGAAQGAWLAGAAAASLLLYLWLNQADPIAAFYLPVTRAWELITGAMLAVAALAAQSHGGSPGRRGRGWQGAGGAASIAAALAVAAIAESSVLPLVLAVAGTVLLIAAGPASPANRALAFAPLVAIGLISYPLYLWHWPLFSLARIYLGSQGAAPVLPLAVALSLALAALTYRYVERPIRTGSLGARATARVLAALAVAVVAAGGGVWASGGVPQRSTPRMTALAEFAVSPHEPFRNADCERLIRDVPGLDFDGCLSSSSAPPAVVLLGDSHANQYFKSLADQLPETPVLHLGRWSCMPFASARHQNRACRVSMGWARDYVVSQPTVSTIVLAGYWAYLMAGAFASNTVDFRAAVPVDRAEADVFLQTGDELLSAFAAAGKRVVLMLDVPNLDFDIRRCAFDPMAGVEHRAPAAKCSLDRRAFEARDAPYGAVMTQLIARHPEVVVFDPRPVLCDGSTCFTMREGRSLYFDSDHLSRRGADLVVSRLIASGAFGPRHGSEAGWRP